jgi:hypothetical protein
MLGIEERKEQAMTFHHHHGMEGCEWCEGRHGVWGAFVLGIGVLVLGGVLFLDNFGVIDGSVLAPFWPVLLIVLGVSLLVQPASSRRIAWGLSWIAVGAIILLNSLGVIAVGIEILWPVVLVIIGVNLLLRGGRRRLRGYAGDSRRRDVPEGETR